MPNSVLIKRHPRSGFTLIELLVAISIIAVVFGAIITSTAGIQSRSRDTQRRSDLAKLQVAIQQYYSDQLYYPGDDLFVAGSPLRSPAGPGQKTYITAIPADPATTPAYRYRSTITTVLNNNCAGAITGCQFYILCADLENATAAETAAAAAGTINCAAQYGANYNYMITPQN